MERRTPLSSAAREARTNARLRVEAAAHLLEEAAELCWTGRLPEWRRVMLLQMAEALTLWARRLRQTGRRPA